MTDHVPPRAFAPSTGLLHTTSFANGGVLSSSVDGALVVIGSVYGDQKFINSHYIPDPTCLLVARRSMLNENGFLFRPYIITKNHSGPHVFVI